MDVKTFFRRLWYFLWKDDSALSWIVNVLIAFVLVKYLIFPGLGFMLGTDLPLVAVVSGSMEHDGSFSSWWSSHAQLYQPYGITEDFFHSFSFDDGFNKGDIMILVGADTIRVGDVIVFVGDAPEPIIHRVVRVGDQGYQTKGDANFASRPDEMNIPSSHILGKAIFRIPYLGWFKIGIVTLLGGVF